jgi:HAD superfamily hydrolase (TIGR01509 family)
MTDPDRSGTLEAAALTLADLEAPAAILFDLDGTLVDTVALRVRAWHDTFAHFGFEVAPESLGPWMGSDGRWLAREQARLAGREMDWAASDEADKMSGAIFDRLNTNPSPLPGAAELLDAIERSGMTWAIATSSQPGQVQKSVDALRLPAAPPITDGSHVKNAKPEPDLLLAAAAQLKVPPERCWYVGDSTWDMLAGTRAGMCGIGVTTGAVDAETLLGAGASVAIATLEALQAELQRRGLID